MKIGMLTSGGDCQGLNPAMRGVAKALYNMDPSTVIYGFTDGYRGLINGNYREMTPRNFSGILTQGGTILGTSREPFKAILASMGAEDGTDKVKKMVNTYRAMQLDCLVILGGNGTHKTAYLLSQQGLNVVTLPKTIDNDIWGTDITFGFQSAVDIATQVIDCIHTTADSHGRVFVIEAMGHKVGWLSLHAGIGGGADVILLPEIPYELENVARVVMEREAQGKRFTIICVAEGAMSKAESQMKKKEFLASRAAMKYPSVSYKLAAELEEMTGRETRVTIPGHFQRGGDPCPADRVLATRLGAAAAGYILEGKFGVMAGMVNGKVKPIPLEKVAGKLKYVPADDPLIIQGKQLGISFGDE